MSGKLEENAITLPQPGDTLLGRYVIDSVIGRGGFSAVYLGRQLGIDRTVAVKCLDPDAIELDPAAPQRFAREARLASSLQHPNTITIFDYGRTDNGILFLVMEHVDGVSLKRILRYGRINRARAISVTKQILSSLREAHGRGIIHRDLKPANIIVCDRAGERDVVKVVDFGIAKVLGHTGTLPDLTKEITGDDRIIGTPRYMSPEQIRGDTLSPATDLYTVGLILFEMLAGMPAIERDTSMAILSAQLSDEPVPVPKNGIIPLRFVPILERALQKNDRARYQSAQEFIDSLDIIDSEKNAAATVPESQKHTRPLAQSRPRVVVKTPAAEFHEAKTIQLDNSDVPIRYVEPSGNYPFVQYPPHRSFAMFSALLGVLLVSVGILLGVVLIPKIGTTVQTVAVPTSTEIPQPMVPADSHTYVNPQHQETSSSLPIQPGPLPALHVEAARLWVETAHTRATNAAEPVVFIFTGTPSSADIYLGANSLGRTNAPLSLNPRDLPAQIEIREEGYRSQSALLSRNGERNVAYELVADSRWDREDATATASNDETASRDLAVRERNANRDQEDDAFIIPSVDQEPESFSIQFVDDLGEDSEDEFSGFVSIDGNHERDLPSETMLIWSIDVPADSEDSEQRDSRSGDRSERASDIELDPSIFSIDGSPSDSTEEEPETEESLLIPVVF